MKILPLIFVTCVLWTAPAVSGEILDLNTVKCKEWIDSGSENIKYTMAWLDGYYMDEDASPIINFDTMKEKAEKLGGYCAANPNVGLGTAAEELFGK
ncbi:hypothetical protein CU048_11075 [Beijerinckiaceae bacterium]|nr:hypothetical protein CU048_11075 [Beijerinckiaceae bacterium]